MKTKQKIVEDAKMRELMYRELISRVFYTTIVSIAIAIVVTSLFIIYLMKQVSFQISWFIMISFFAGLLLSLFIWVISDWCATKGEEYAKMLKVKK